MTLSRSRYAERFSAKVMQKSPKLTKIVNWFLVIVLSFVQPIYCALCVEGGNRNIIVFLRLEVLVIFISKT